MSTGGAFIDDTLQLGNIEALSTYIFGSRRSQQSLPAAKGRLAPCRGFNRLIVGVSRESLTASNCVDLLCRL